MCTTSFFKKIFIYLATPGLSCTWELLVVACGTQFPDQGSNLGPCIRCTESWPLDHQGSPHIFIYSSIDGHLSCFHVLAIVNSAAMNIEVQVFFGYMPRSGTAGNHGNSIFSFAFFFFFKFRMTFTFERYHSLLSDFINFPATIYALTFSSMSFAFWVLSMVTILY